jgi:hypothetical protein
VHGYSGRNFVPVYTSIAQTAITKVDELNSFHDPPTYTNITFAGVNCVAFRDLCTKYSIEFYPTVIGMNFANQKGKYYTQIIPPKRVLVDHTEKTKIQGIKNDILKFLKNNYFTVCYVVL